jgi:hypothetical protein
MSPLTIFLGKLLGLYSIILALAMMSRKQGAVAAITALVKTPALVMYVNILGLAAGLAIIIGHNIWSGGPLPVVITLVGWFAAVRGAVFLALPPEAMSRFFEAVHYEKRFYLFMGLALVIGLYLTYASYTA